MSYTIIRPKDRQEWLRHRESGIGSSEVGTLLGLNPWETPYQLWRRKRGLDAPKEETFAMKAGHYLEDAVSLFYRDETGKEIIKSSASDWLIVNDEKNYLRVSPDRTFWIPGKPKSDRNKGILECKTTQMEVDKDSLPQHWFCQLQYQLGVAELEQGALAWLTMGREFGYKDILFDAEFYAWMIEEVDRFWIDNIVGGQEPPLSNVEDVLIKNPRHMAGKSVEADDDTLELCRSLKALKESMSVDKTEKDRIEGVLKMRIGDAESIFTQADGRKVTLATWKAAKDSDKFDEKRFAAEHPDLYADYRITVPGTRRFLLK
ncbi:MAG: YqaJ viral recombinase family protein [Parabacteroides sp.]